MDDELPFAKRKPYRDAKARAFYRQTHPACEGCGARRSVEVHHLVPRSCSGSDEESNLAALCVSCHRSWTGVNQTRADWFAAREKTMTAEMIAKVRRAVRALEAT